MQDADRLALRLGSGFKLSAPTPQSCWASVCLCGKWEGALPYLVFEGERMSKIQAFVGCRVLPPPLATTGGTLYWDFGGLWCQQGKKLEGVGDLKTGPHVRCLASTGLEGTPPGAPPLLRVLD